MKKQNKIAHIGKLLLLLAMVLIWKHSAIWYAATDSLPFKYYFVTKKQYIVPQRQELVAIKGHDTKYLHDAKFIKIVGGVFGDHIQVINDSVWVAGTFIGKLKSHTLDHSRLTPIKSQIIPVGWMFVYGTHNNSFDSRYQEFGLVNVDHVIGRVTPLW